MLIRGENICAGTSTTGTGTLTFAATPAAVGALSLYQWLTAVNGFTNGKVLLVPYTIIEYTDATFATPSQVETGIGTITLGASNAATTLARTTVQTTQTGSTYLEKAPTALNIGTAANVLIFIGVNAWSIPAMSPYLDESLVDTYGVGELALGATTNYTPNSVGATGDDFWRLMYIPRPVFVQVARFNVTTAYGGTTGVPVSTAFSRLYQLGTNGKPDKLLIDFGSYGTNPLNSTGIKSATAATGMLLTPGEYWHSQLMTWSGATGTVTHAVLRGHNPVHTALQYSGVNHKANQLATGGSNPAPDPANVTGWANDGANNNTWVAGFRAT